MCPNCLEMYDRYGADEDKRILLIACRVFLPHLSSYKILYALIEIDSLTDEENSYGQTCHSSTSQTFRSEYLQASIEAAWYSWAGAIFFRWGLWYILWMVCIICLDYTSITELKIANQMRKENIEARKGKNMFEEPSGGDYPNVLPVLRLHYPFTT